MDSLFGTPTRESGENTDPNLALMTEQQNATSDTMQPPPPPPPPSTSLQPTAPTSTPTAPSPTMVSSTSTPQATTTPPPPPPPPAGYGGTGTYGNLGYADAVQQAYKDSQARMAATGVEEAPIDYSMAGLESAGLWGMSDADRAANTARTQSIINDPTSTAAAKSLASMDGYGTPQFDKALNDGSNPQLASTVQQLLRDSAAQRSTAPSTSTSQIFASDPSRPGAGYVMVNGQPVRIEGTTAAGRDVGGQPGYDAKGNRVVTAQDRYILEGGQLGDFINPDDYYNFIGAYHGADAPNMTTAATSSSGGGGASMQLSPASRIALPSGPATDAGTPSSGLGTKMPVAGATSPAGSGGVTIGGQILPNTSVDRFKLAQERFDQAATDSDPAYQLALRSATQRAAGAGRIGSGMLRTSYGDLANGRAQQLDSLRKGFLQDALEGTIQDGRSDRNELRTERGYQGSLEQQAFDRALQRWQMENAAQQQQFENGVTLTTLGERGNPADYYTELAKQYGIDPTQLMMLAASFGQGGSSGTKSPSIPSITIPQAPIPTGTFDLPSLPAGTAVG